MEKVKINKQFIKKWHPKYDDPGIGVDEEEYRRIKRLVAKEIKNDQTLTKKTFVDILNWKSARVKGIINLGKYAVCKNAIRKSVNATGFAKVIPLDGVYGIGVPVASTILHYIYPNLWPIMDIRTIEVLKDAGCIKSKAKDQKRYKIFKNEILNIKARLRVFSLREIDRALFSYHKLIKRTKIQKNNCRRKNE